MMKRPFRNLVHSPKDTSPEEGTAMIQKFSRIPVRLKSVTASIMIATSSSMRVAQLAKRPILKILMETGTEMKNSTIVSCDPLVGYVINDEDCDDTLVDVHPGAVEICNGLDDNCDGLSDDASAVDTTLWYADFDLDGYGNVSNTILACTQPQYYTSDSSDCDDTDNDTYRLLMKSVMGRTTIVTEQSMTTLHLD